MLYYWAFLIVAFYCWMGGIMSVLCHTHLGVGSKFWCTNLGLIWPLVWAYAWFKAAGEIGEAAVIFGDWPCCDGPMAMAVDEARMPCWLKLPCPHCGAECWHHLDPVDSKSYTRESFEAEFQVVGRTVCRVEVPQL